MQWRIPLPAQAVRTATHHHIHAALFCIRPPSLGVAPAQAEHSMADAATGKGEVTKEPRVFPRRRPDLSDAQAERREALRAPPPPPV